MKFFKYLICFLFITISSLSHSAQWTGILQDSFPLLKGKRFDSCEQFVNEFNKAYQPNGDAPWNGNVWGKLTYSHTEFIASDAYYPARFRCYANSYSGGSKVSFLFTADSSGDNACKKGLVSTAYFDRVPDVTACLGVEYGNLAGCEANLQHVEVLKNKHLGKYGAYGKFATNGKQCNFSTNPKDTGNGYTVPPRNVCDNKSVCEVSSPNDCPSGYSSGTFNGKTYCVMRTPNNPNPKPSDALSASNGGTSGGTTGGTSGGTSGGTTGGTTGGTSGGTTGGTSGGTTGGTSGGTTGGISGGTSGEGTGQGGDGDGNGILSALQGLIDWFKEEPNMDNEQPVEVEDRNIGDWQSKAQANYINGSSSCPADYVVPISWMGATTELKLSYKPFCYFAEMIRPAVILGAWIAGLMIIVGGRTKE